MSAHFFFFFFTVLIFFMLPNLSTSDDSQLPSLGFSFVDNNNRFRAGEPAAIEIKILKDFKSEKDRYSFSPNVSLMIGPNNVMGNNSLITGIWCDMKNLRIHFTPITVGLFYLLITEDRFHVMDPFLIYRVTPGRIYEPGGIVSWLNQMDGFVVGTTATVLILPKDAFGNTVTPASEGQNIYNFQVYATTLNGSNVNIGDVRNYGWNQFDYIYIEFFPLIAGHLLVHIKHKNHPLIGSPMPLTIHPDVVKVANCLAHWSVETKFFQLSSIMETFVSQRDKYRNLVPGWHEFDLKVIEKGAKLSLPIGFLENKEVSPGIQSFSFRVPKPGDFFLIITDKDNNKIMNMPFEFTSYIGNCDARESVVNGSGLHDSVAGKVSKFSISLKDAYQYPAPLELEKIQVQITLPSLSLRLNPQIHPKSTQPIGMLSYGALGPTGMAYDPTVFSHDNSAENSETKSSDFEVDYVPEKAGVYEIRVFCGNIQLNDGHPFTKVVSAGEVNVSLSGVVRYDEKTQSGDTNYITAQLLDSFYNPVSSQVSRLHLKMSSSDKTTFYFVHQFADNFDGTYSASYRSFTDGDYECCVSYDGKHILPWPFAVKVYPIVSYPGVNNDTVDVWEDQSIGFYPLDNDRNIFENSASIFEFQRPSHGSVLQYGTAFRYTPYKGYYGYDTFIYTISDAFGCKSTGRVDVRVLTVPPQFLSYPVQLQAVEDTLSPKVGGFPSFEMVYSDSQENISVMLTARNGTVFLSPILMQLWDPMWDEISISILEGKDGFLCISGRLEVVNFALNSLQYLGNANFSGWDMIVVTTINKNGKGHLNVPLFVEPINDPPIINVPEYILLEKENKEFLLFDRQRNEFNSSIEDADRFSFPGNETHFRVMFSVEVSSGTFSARLPAQLTSTTELKLKRSSQWQPLHTFVQISKHFTVNRVKGIRFRGTINECNTLLNQMLYYGDKRDGVLKLRVSDMGWHGCYPDCSENISVPLIAEATVNLLTRPPMDPSVALSLGSMIIIEAILLASLAMILIYFTCKCAFILLREKQQQAQSPNHQLDEQMESEGSPENTIELTGNGSSSSTQSE